MDPNSQNQYWSMWTFRVRPGLPRATSVKEVAENFARPARKVFGSAAKMKVDADIKKREWVIKILAEGQPADDPDYREHIRQLFLKLFIDGFGPGTVLKLEATLMAGKTDGKAPSQMLIMPGLKLDLDSIARELGMPSISPKRIK